MLWGLDLSREGVWFAFLGTGMEDEMKLNLLKNRGTGPDGLSSLACCMYSTFL